MANFSIQDAFYANVAPQEYANEAALMPGGSGILDEATMLRYLGLNPDGTNALGGGGSPWAGAGNGQVSVADSILSSNMDSGGMFDWGDMIGPGLLLAGPFAGMMGAFGAAGAAGAGAGAGAGGAMDMGVGLQGWMDSLGASAAGGAGAGAAGAGGWDYGEFLQSIGIDPSSTQFAGGTMSNADIMSQIMGGTGAESSGLGQLLRQVQSMPGGSQIAQQLLNSLTGSGSGTGSGGLGSLLPLLGVGSGLNTMFNSNQAVDPNMIASLWQAGQNTYNTSLDPQNALRDRTQQQVVDASRAGQSARGIAMSPYGAGLENDAVRNFNIDWQNQKLQRQTQGTQAFSGAGNTAAHAGIANNAQAFLQNQTGLNNLTTGLQGLTGGGTQGGSTTQAGGTLGSWLTNLFSSGGSAPSGSNYNAAGTFQPYYSGYDSSGGPAYG